MIAFTERGMTILMGTLTRNFLRFFRLSPTQCAPNMFRVLGSIEVLNERMNLKLSHHNVNWIYNLHNMKGQGYYLKSRYPEIRLIQCLPISNKGLKEDFLIFSREWHDGSLVQLRREHQVGVQLSIYTSWFVPFFHFPLFFVLIEMHFFLF